jgi:tripartite ATP-independent transporter DctM subunit
MLGASTGIVGATVVTMGVLNLPVMLKRGYEEKAATGIILASGTLGQIIPPSIILVLLGSVLNVPVGDLFIAAVIPGLILVLLFFIWILVQTKLKPEALPSMPDAELKKFTGKEKYKRIINAFVLPFILVVAVLGSIFAGIASPTEAAAIGALGASVLTIIKRRFNLPTLKAVMLKTTTITSMVFMILVGAAAFGLVFRGLHGDRYLADLILFANFEPYQFLIIAMLVIFICGFFIDFIEITYIVVPVIAPIFHSFELDFIWLGILIAMNLQSSFLTPPFGFSIFYLKGVAPKEITTAQLYKGVIPYVVIQLFALLLVASIPMLALWLPEFLG